MSELRLVWDPAKGRADLALVNGQLDLSQALETWVIVSLFTDRLAEGSDKVIRAPAGDRDRRGWWGDNFLAADHPGDKIGSRLWLLERAKSDRNTPALAEGYIREALQWMLEDGLATAIDVACAFIGGDTSKLRAEVTIEHQTGSAFSFRYDWAWGEVGS